MTSHRLKFHVRIFTHFNLYRLVSNYKYKNTEKFSYVNNLQLKQFSFSCSKEILTPFYLLLVTETLETNEFHLKNSKVLNVKSNAICLFFYTFGIVTDVNF